MGPSVPTPFKEESGSEVNIIMKVISSILLVFKQVTGPVHGQSEGLSRTEDQEHSCRE